MEYTLPDPACFYGLSPELREQAIFSAAGGVTPPPVLPDLNRISSGLLLDEQFDDDSIWTSEGSWTFLTEPALLCFGPLPDPILEPGGYYVDGVRNPQLVYTDAAGTTRYLIFDGGNGVAGWRTGYATSIDKGETFSITGELTGLGKIGGGTWASVATGWVSIQGALWIAQRVTTDTLFAPPDTGLPAAPYGWDTWTAPSIAGPWTGVIAQVADAVLTGEKLPGSSYLEGGLYHNFAEGTNATPGYKLAIATSATQTGTFTCIGSVFPSEDDIPMENGRGEFHVGIGKYFCIANLINGSFTDSNAVILSDSITDWSASERHIVMRVSPLFGLHAIGTCSHITGPDGEFIHDATNGFIPVTYDDATNSPLDPGFHRGRRIRAAILEPSLGGLRYNNPDAVARSITRAFVHTDFICEIQNRFRNTTASTSIGFFYRSDNAGNMYQAYFRNTEGFLLFKSIGGVAELVYSFTGGLNFAKSWSTIKFSVIGAHHVVQVDGQTQMDLYDPSHYSGTHISFSGFGADGEVRLLRARTSDMLTLRKLPASAEVLIRTATLPVQRVTASVRGNAAITLDHWPHTSVDVNEGGTTVTQLLYGGDVWEYQGPDATPGDPEPFDADTQDWLDRQTTAGFTVPDDIAVAHDAFVVALKAASIWTKIQRLNTFSGPSLGAALIPLKATLGDATDTNRNFIAGNYSQAVGLTSDGSTRSLGTGVALVDLGASETILIGFDNRTPRASITTSDGYFMGAYSAANGFQALTAKGGDDFKNYVFGGTSDKSAGFARNSASSNPVGLLMGVNSAAAFMYKAVYGSSGVPAGGTITTTEEIEVFALSVAGSPAAHIDVTSWGYVLGNSTFTSDEISDLSAAWNTLQATIRG